MSVLFLAALLAAAQPAAPLAPPPQGTEASGKPVLTLAEAERSARERQPQLQQARSLSDAASARADEARAPLLPQVTGSAAYERTTGNFASRPGQLPSSVSTRATSSWTTFDYFNFGLTASQLVYDFGQTSGRWRAAQASAGAQRQSEHGTEMQVLLTVRSAFFNARAQRDLVIVARDTLANQEAHLRQVEGFVRAGTRPEIDLLQARTDRANAQVALINAQNSYATARAQLR
jgi:outer membrane protein